MKKFLLPILLFISLPKTIISSELNRELHKLCSSAIDYTGCIQSNTKSKTSISPANSNKQIYLFFQTNTISSNNGHYNLNEATIIATPSIRACNTLASKKNSFFNTVGNSVYSNMGTYYRCIKGAKDGIGKYKLYLFTQNRYRSDVVDDGTQPSFFYSIPMLNVSQCLRSKLEIKSLINEIKNTAVNEYIPDEHAECVRTPI